MANARTWEPLSAPQVKQQTRAGLWIEVTVASLFLLVLTSLPTLFGYWAAPADKWFSGIVFNVHDTAQYLSWMRESATRFFIDNKLTSEPNSAVFVNLHWWIPGRVAALLGLSLGQIYQVFRVLMVPLYVAAAYWMCSLFFVDGRRLRFAFWLTTLSSGLGWIWIVDKYINGLADPRWPHDVYTTPGNTLWVLVASPHLTFALALTLLALGLAWWSYQRNSLALAALAGVVTLFLGLGHIYDVVTVWAVLAVFGLVLTVRNGWQWRTFILLGIVPLISLPAPLYFGWVSSSANPTWQVALAQYDNLGAFTPDPLHLLILLGVTFVLAASSFAVRLPRWRSLSNRDLFLLSWFVANLVIIYLPLRFQVMLLTGFQFVLAVLAVDWVFDSLLPWLHRRFAQRSRWFDTAQLVRWVPALLLLAVLPTNLYLFSWRLLDLARAEYPYYLYRDEVAAMQWIDDNAAEDSVVLSGFVPGHYVPGLAGTRAYLSNAVMTLDFVEKRDQVTAFFTAATGDAERCALLTSANIDYVFHGPYESAIGAYAPSASPFLRPVFTTNKVTIYEVNPQCASG